MKKTLIYCSGNRLLWLFLPAILIFTASLPVFTADIETLEAHVRELPLDAQFNNIQKIVSIKKKLYILDTGNHRVVILKDGKISGQIGIIGNNIGALYYPAGLCIDGHSGFYLIDRGNHRIQVFDSNGNYISHFSDQPNAYGIAVNSKGNIYLGKPKTKKLISVHSSNGKKLAEFGDLVKPSEIYGNDYKKYDETLILPMNRTYLTMGENDLLWAGFYHLPVICKFDENGNLLRKKIISLENLEPLKKAVRAASSHPQYLSYGFEGVTLVLMIKDMVYEKNSKRLYVLMGDNRILVLNSQANEEYVINPRIIKGAIEKICVTETGEILASFFFSPKLYKLEILDRSK